MVPVSDKSISYISAHSNTQYYISVIHITAKTIPFAGCTTYPTRDVFNE